MSQALPHIDEHAVLLDVAAEDAWPVVADVVSSFASQAAWQIVAKGLRCKPHAVVGVPENVGATFPGFRVSRSQPPTEWALEGEHRFARYALAFRIQPVDGASCRLTADSHAAFPGRRGAIYRALIVGTRGHVVGVRIILRSIKRRAERPQEPLRGRPSPADPLR